MTLRVTINDTGFRARIANLETVLPEIISTALRDIGIALEGGMKREVPVDTGWLKNNILFEVSGQTLRAGVSAAAPYGKFVALGTRFHRPNPYHLRALDDVLPEITDIVREAVQRRVGGI